jgi:hypothetical protein
VTPPDCLLRKGKGDIPPTNEMDECRRIPSLLAFYVGVIGDLFANNRGLQWDQFVTCFCIAEPISQLSLSVIEFDNLS